MTKAHAEAETSREGSHDTQRSGAHGCTERLVIVNARYLRAALHAEARLLSAVPLPLVDPRETYGPAVAGHLGAIYHLDRTVLEVTHELAPFGCGPTRLVLLESIGSGLRINTFQFTRQMSVATVATQAGMAVRVAVS